MHRAYGSRTRDPPSAGGEHASGYRTRNSFCQAGAYEKQTDGSYILRGGGYGHGLGMSQNGANEMAKTGMSHTDILTFFYPGTKVY